MIFTAAEVRAIRQGKMTAVLTPRSEQVRAGNVRLLRRRGAGVEEAPAAAGRPREVLAFIEERLDLRESVEIVCDQMPDGERVAVCFTVLAVAELTLAELTVKHARACGRRTTGELAGEWVLEHPRTSEMWLVWFALGDLRDVPRLVSSGWPDYTSDVSRAMAGEPEALSAFDQAGLSAFAAQSYAAHLAQMSRDAAQGSAGERLRAIQAGSVTARK